MKAHVEDIDYEAARRPRGASVRHDVMAHVHAYGDVLPQRPAASSTWAPPPAMWAITPM